MEYKLKVYCIYRNNQRLCHCVVINSILQLINPYKNIIDVIDFGNNV